MTWSVCARCDRQAVLDGADLMKWRVPATLPAVMIAFVFLMASAGEASRSKSRRSSSM